MIVQLNALEAFKTVNQFVLAIWDYGPMGGLPQSPLGLDNLALGSDNLESVSYTVISYIQYFIFSRHCTGSDIRWVGLPQSSLGSDNLVNPTRFGTCNPGSS